MKIRKGIKAALALAMCFSAVVGSTSINVMASGGDVTVKDSEEKITIGNAFLEREFAIENNSVTTSAINNLRANKILNPADGSEDFIINLMNTGIVDNDTEGNIKNEPEYVYTGTSLDKSAWSGTITNSAGAQISEASVKLAFDGDTDTYPNEYQVNGHPITLAIDLGSEQTIAAMSVNKRPGYPEEAFGTNGTMGGYKVYVSDDNATWDLASEGEFTAEDYNLHEADGLYNVGDMVYVNFAEAKTARYVKVEQTSVAFGTAAEFTSSEVSFYSDQVEKKLVIKEPTKALDRAGWKATVKNASGASFPAASVAKLFDGNTATHPDEYTISGNPMTLDIDLGSKQSVSSLSIDKRPGYSDPVYGKNGTLGEFELYVSDDGSKWKIAGAGNFTAEAYNLHEVGGLHNVGDRVFANFTKTYETRYVRLVQKSCSIGNSEEFTTSEVNLYEDEYQGYNWNTTVQETSKNMIRSSALTYEDHQTDTLENGKKLTISFAPYTVGDVVYDIDYVVVMENGKHYMRSFVEISASDHDKAQIDYIDMDRFILPENVEGLWNIPDEKDISSMWIGKHELMLGQPIYANGLFMGSEFPAAETDVEENATKIRYYSGKTFTKMKADNQLTTDGKMVTWQNVIGAGEDIDAAVVQTALFSYIDDIATPTDFRKQYNSWYDNMMNITDESIGSSFLGAEANLSAEGVEPLDSYVVDDGWNNYYSTDTGTVDGKNFVDPGSSAGSGTPNQTGFWEFNNKFPNELYTSSSLVDKFQSTFGVWVGPQGGYNYFGGFGKYIEHAGTGFMQSNSALGNVVCTGSRKYIKNFEKMAVDYQDRFNVEYWKWDGFASRPCNNASHDHMVGGNKNMYFTSDMWEAWIDLFDNVRANNPEIFINATCYVNVSPWMLQWVNTVWLQDSGDTGQIGTGERHEQKIYYRDQVYHQLYKQNQVQFPLKNIYNHDPIYGVSDGSHATTEVFREFLMANAVRGTAFWELYYSPSILDDAKWKVTADALDWAEKNFDVLENAKLFGNKPSEGVYGYSAWKGNEGIVSFTNPLDTEQTYTLTVDNIVGAPTTISKLKGIQVEPYQVGILEQMLSYGDELEVTLQPHETKILHYGEKDTVKPKVESISNVDNTTIRMKFSERVNADATYALAKAKADINVESATLLEDYRTVELKVSDELVNVDDAVQEVTIMMKDVVDAYGNATADEQITFKAYANGTIANMSKMTGLTLNPATGNEVAKINSKQEKVSDTGVEGDGTFAVSFNIKTESTDAMIVSQGDDLQIAVDADGYVNAKVGTQTISSKEEVTTVIKKASGKFNTEAYQPTTSQSVIKGTINDGNDHVITLSRSANGMVKLFVDGQLAASVYDEAKVNEQIDDDAIQLGSTGLNATIANFEVVNHAVEYKEAAAIAEASAIDTEKKLDRSKWTATACSEMSGTVGDASAMAAIDGNENSWWHTNYTGSDAHPMGEHWLEIDFGEEIAFDNFIYTGRGSSSNGSIKGYRLEAKVNGEWKTIKTGDMSDSKTTTIVLDETVQATAMKLIPTSTHNGVNHAAAVEVNVSVFDQAITKEDVKKAYESAKIVFDSVNENTYTEASYEAYEKAFNTLKELNDLVNGGADTTQFVLDKIVEGVESAKNALIVDTTEVDKTALMATIDVASKVKAAMDEYKSDHWDAFEETLTKAIAVNADADVKQKAVNEANTALEEAMDKLVKRVDNTLLKDAVEDAQAYQEHNYTTASWKPFASAMKDAKAILENRDATEKEITDAMTTLNTTVKALVADKDALHELIAEAQKLDVTNKTEASVDALNLAIRNAEAVATKEDASVEEITAVMQELETAMAGLQDKVTPPEEGGSQPDTKPNSNGTNTGDSSNTVNWMMLLVLSAGALLIKKKSFRKINN